MTDKFLTVSQLNLYIKSLLDFDEFMSNVWVMGEVSNFKCYTSGHFYLTLKDENSSLKAVMFKTYAQSVNFMPENGMKLLVHGRMSVYERDGVYQLYIEDMEPYGTGSLFIAFEQLKAKLEKEGLFEESRKKKLPEYPQKIAVVTSSKGAAVHDIINVITRRYKLCDILICPVSVQGNEAAEQIAGAIEYVNNKTNSDLIIVGRGGGAYEDLMCFNEEIVARAIYNSDIPIISAIGHETDFTISDFVADIRAATPSVAGELATACGENLKTDLKKLKERLNVSIINLLDSKKNKLNDVKKTISSELINNIFNNKKQNIDNSMQKINISIGNILNKKSTDFIMSNEKLKILNPLNIISKGYSLVSKENGELIKQVDNINVSDKIKIRVSDGIILAEVYGKEKYDG